MKHLYKMLLASIFTCCGFSVIAAESNSNAQTVQLEKYTNAEKGYSVEYPSDWKKNDVPQLDLVLFAPAKEVGEMPHASVNIVSEKVGKGINLEQFYSESAANLATALKEVQVEKSGTADLNGVTSKWIQYTHVMQGVKFKVLQYFIVADETIFLITFSSSADEFEQYKPEFEKIANSFKVASAAVLAQPAKKTA